MVLLAELVPPEELHYRGERPTRHTAIEPGTTFGKLIVVRRVRNSIRKEACYLCRCGCGTAVLVAAKLLRYGFMKTCGVCK